MSRLSLPTKFYYGLGSIGEGLFQRGYEYFAFFYFVAILGMSPILGGVAMMLSTVLDAVTDPVVGSLSDNWKSRGWGRRHPFMYASVLPFALAWFLLLSPPAGLGDMGLFWWFLGFSILLRQSLTLYQVPHAALGAELTDDYQERTSVATWRIVQGFVGTFGVVALFTVVFFRETEAYPDNGLLNPAGYPKVALWGAILIVLSVGLSALGTHREIARLARPTHTPRRFTPAAVLAEIGIALRNPSFRALLIGATLFVTSFSINEVFNQWVRIYFWGLTASQIASLLVPALVGFTLGLPTTGALHRRFDKKATVIVASLLPACISATTVILRLVGVIPQDPTIVMTVLSTASLLSASCAGVAFISAASMIADAAQEVRYTSGRDVTGVMFAGHSFAQKLASALAHFLASAMLEALAIPQGAAVAELPLRTIQLLGLSSLVATAFAAGGIAFYFGYRIDRERHREMTLGLLRQVEAARGPDPSRAHRDDTAEAPGAASA